MSYSGLGYLGQEATPTSSVRPLLLVGGALVGLALLGGFGAERHQRRSLAANKGKRRRKRRRSR